MLDHRFLKSDTACKYFCLQCVACSTRAPLHSSVSPYSPSLPAPQTWPSRVAWPARRPPLPLYYSCVRLRRRRRATPPQAGLQVVASVKCYILRLVFILPHFSLPLLLQSTIYCRAAIISWSFFPSPSYFHPLFL